VREALEGELVLRGRTGSELWGFGQHPSTSLCLSILTGLYSESGPRPKRVIELDCGSGLLCIAAARLGAELAYGIEPDPGLRALAEENARHNQADARFVSPAHESTLAPFDLALANLTAAELTDCAQTLATWAARGHLLIAGFVEEEREALEQKFLSLGFRFLYRETREGVIASIFKARTADARGLA